MNEAELRHALDLFLVAGGVSPDGEGTYHAYPPMVRCLLMTLGQREWMVVTLCERLKQLHEVIVAVREGAPWPDLPADVASLVQALQAEYGEWDPRRIEYATVPRRDE